MREKLIELLITADDYEDRVCNGHPCRTCPYDGTDCSYRAKADHLIAHGVTVQEWISVSEPPKGNGYYMCYVLTSAVGEKVKYEQMLLYWEDDIWLYRHNSYRMCRNVTHWMPLPQPPISNTLPAADK